MKTIILAFTIAIITSFPVLAAEGTINVLSSFSVAETADRLENILKEKGMTVFNRIHHSQAAGKVGIELRDTELIIFGNPKVGSPLMQCNQTVAIDLPQKGLIWQDDDAKVWISYNDPQYLQKRHGIAGCQEVLAKIEKALAAFSKAAAGE